MKKTLNPLLFTEKGRDQTDILVRFVSINQNIKDIERVFEDCGPIDEIHFITSNNVKIFKDAYVRFKTKEGRRKALAKIDATRSDSDIVVEAVSPSTYSSMKIHAPSLIGVTGVPTSLVKNPTRTVMVKGLAHNLASHHLEDAFSFCGARITGFFMGSSSSVAYIEFETEDAKEKAIGTCFIPVSGTKLSILRIDAPNTTVVRISNAPLEYSRTRILCSSYGKIKKVISRSPGVWDIHYKVTEWPVIVDILNSLNGQVVDEQQLIAQPASVIPVEILKYLWSQPDGRRHVSSVIQKLCRNIEKYDMGKVKDIAVQYYEDTAVELYQR